MNKENTEKLLKDFPKLYRQYYDDKTQTCMCWGFDTENGWFKLIYKLSQDLTKVAPDCEASQVKQKWGCYDTKTQVLTKNGWKYFKDISKTDMIATLKDNEYLEYQLPTDIIKYKYNGKMYKLVSRGIDLLVTPNHNLYVSKPPTINGRYKPNKYTYFPFELTTYEKYFGKNKMFKKSAIWNGVNMNKIIIPGYVRNDSYVDKLGRKCNRTYNYESLEFKAKPFLKFLGWYVAEGHYNKSNISLCLNYTNKKEIKLVSDILNELNLKHRIYYKTGIIRVYNKMLGEWLQKECGHLSYNKKCPTFIKELNPKLIKLFLNNLYYGDGFKDKTSWILTTTSKILADDVQELALKINKSSSLSSRFRQRKQNKHNICSKRKCYEINLLNKSNVHETQQNKISKSFEEKLIDYNNDVYCVTVPNKIILVRRNGKPYWCGNSLRFYVDNCNEAGHDLISKAEEESYNVCEECGEPGKLREDLPFVQTLCDKDYDEKIDPVKIFKKRMANKK